MFSSYGLTNNISKEQIIEICNSVSKSIQFVMELPNEEDYLPFLDCEIYRENGIFKSRLYSKGMHYT